MGLKEKTLFIENYGGIYRTSLQVSIMLDKCVHKIKISYTIGLVRCFLLRFLLLNIIPLLTKLYVY